MSAELPKSNLGSLIKHQKGNAFKSKDYLDEGTAVVRVSNFTADSISSQNLKYVRQEIAVENRKVTLKKDDIVVATVGSWPNNPASIVGKTVRVPSKLDGALMNQNSVILRVANNDYMDQIFLFIALKSARFSEYLVSVAQGSANQASITLSDIFSYEVEWPEKTKRKWIVSIIDSLSSKIELNRQINQTLESMAQTIFKSWFVNFDPVKAKIAALEACEDSEGVTRAAMRAISGKSDDELDKMEGGQPEDYAQLKTTAGLFPAAMQETELGAVPEGWEVKKITDFGSVVCGKTPPKRAPENYGGDIPFLKIPDMHGDVFATNTTEYLSAVGENTQIKKQIPKGSVCVSCIATVGLVSIATKACHTNQQINSIVPTNTMFTPYLYFSMLERNKLLHDLASGGSTTLNLNTGNFAKIYLLNPGSEILKEFYEKVSPIFEMLLSNDYQIQQLTQLRDTLLPKLLSGELSIDAIEMARGKYSPQCPLPEADI